MNSIAFRAIIIGLLAGLATFLALGPSANFGSQIWAVLLAWASFVHLGGGISGLRRAILNNLLGVVVGLAALAFATHMPETISVGYPLWAAVGVGLTICLIATVSSGAPIQLDLPSALIGYAAALVAGLSDHRFERIIAPTLENPVVGVSLSLVAGAVLAFGVESITDFLRKRVPFLAVRA